MRAVNLIPAESRGRSGSGAPSTGMQLPTYVLLGMLAAAVVLVTIYVLASNTITTRTADLSNLKTQVATEQAEANQLGQFTKFSQLAQTRVSTVRSIADARFDWNQALSDLAKVVPANTTLQAVNGSVVPGAGTGGSGGGGGSLRADESGPAFELSGCTDSQDDVARLMSRLRLIDSVTRVTFNDLAEPTTTTTGGGAQGCGSGPTFDLLVFFQPVANAGANGVTSISGVSTTTPSTSGGAQ
jgi:Tfp pilus assembly protein PilN